MRFVLLSLTILFLFSCSRPKYDYLIKNGTIIDGSGKPRFQADLAVRDGKIVKIAPEIKDTSRNVIDAQGRIVSPGFIDMLSWACGPIVYDGHVPSVVQQGITTNGTFFNPAAEWDTLGINVFDHLGWHQGSCTPNSIHVAVKKNNAFFYPNPVVGSTFMVKATEIIESVEITNAIGQVVVKKANPDYRGDMQIETTNMNRGMYMVKINFIDNSSIVKKVVVE